jgi:hypothetical protein
MATAGTDHNLTSGVNGNRLKPADLEPNVAKEGSTLTNDSSTPSFK